MQRARKSARQKARRLQYNGQKEHDGKHGDNDAGDIALGAIVENTRLAIDFLKGGFLFDGAGTRPAARRSIFKRDALFGSDSAYSTKNNSRTCANKSTYSRFRQRPFHAPCK